jgi:hypothetical protein
MGVEGEADEVEIEGEVALQAAVPDGDVAA